MKTLLEFLNELPVAEQRLFAKRCGTSIGYLRQIAYGHRKCLAELAINIERESKRAVVCEELCPSADWAYVRAERRRKGARRVLPDRRTQETHRHPKKILAEIYLLINIKPVSKPQSLQVSLLQSSTYRQNKNSSKGITRHVLQITQVAD